MKGKYKYSVAKVYGYCMWTYKYPPDDWCIFGIQKWRGSPGYIRYSLCLFGFELRVDINRKFIQEPCK